MRGRSKSKAKSPEIGNESKGHKIFRWMGAGVRNVPSVNGCVSIAPRRRYENDCYALVVSGFELRGGSYLTRKEGIDPGRSRTIY